MGVDLHRIGTGISSGSSRNGFGNIVSFPSVAPSFPAAGSYNSTLSSVTYPIAEGGSFLNIPVGGDVPNQQCDVDVKNDGSGGTYTDWSTVTNVYFIFNGEFFYFDTTLQPIDIEVPSGSGVFFTGGTYQLNYYHDGLGSYYDEGVNDTYYVNGANTNLGSLSVDNQTEVPSSSGSYYNDGTYTGYSWDGNGGYNYPIYSGSYYPNNTFIVFVPDGTFSNSTEVPSGSGNYYDAKECGNNYFWDGGGGYNYAVPVCIYYPHGTFIRSFDGNDFYWDGAGSYYS